MSVKDTFFSKKLLLNKVGELVSPDYPLVMAIVNVTPDSFYSQSRVESEKEIQLCIEKAIYEGAQIIDIGAYSSRPNSKDIDIEEEKNRLQIALSVIKKHFPKAWVSVDSYRSEVVRWAVGEYGIGMVNDISGGMADDQMFHTVSELNIPYTLMHMRGTPQTMQSMAQYNNVTKEVIYELSVQLEKAKAEGVKDIIIDPGFGFAKTMEQNYELLSNLDSFKFLEQPILVGISRKSMIFKLLNTSPDESLNGTTALHTIALLKGADILRVHDVKQAVETIKIVNQLKKV